MGMRISGSDGVNQSSGVAAWQQRQQSVKDLFSSLQSGDLAAAQKAFASMTGGSSTVNPSSPFAAIGQALQNGDLAGAQKAAQQLQANRAGGHHHHHSAAASAAATGSSGTSGSGGTMASGPGSLINIVA